jgi:hypothetical protein
MILKYYRHKMYLELNSMLINLIKLWYIIKIILLFSINSIKNKLSIKVDYNHFMDYRYFLCTYKNLNRLLSPKIK